MYHHHGYNSNHPIIHHGISVAAPAVFNFTAQSDPDRHLLCAKMFGVDTSNTKRSDAGPLLADALRTYLEKLDVPNGIGEFGVSYADVDGLVHGTLPQNRVTKLAPEVVDEEVLARLFEESLTI